VLRGAFFLGVLLFGTSAQAQDTPTLEGARTLFVEARFEEAVEAFDAILEASDVSAATAGEAHRYLVALHVMLEQPDRATPHIEALLAIDPAALAPDGAPPSVEEFFASARARIAPPEDEAAGASDVETSEESGNDDAVVFGLIGAAGALLIAGAIVLALVLTNDSSNVARFEGVTVVGW